MAYIRKMYDKKHQQSCKFNDKSAVPDMWRKDDLTNKLCYYCGQHGHMTVNCKFMAKLINATEHLNKVDTKAKKELQEHFRQIQKRRQSG